MVFLLLGVLFFLYLKDFSKATEPEKNKVNVENNISIPEDSSLKEEQKQPEENTTEHLDLILSGLELPKCDGRNLIRHAGFCLEYNENHEQAKWVAYQLTASETVKRFSRSDNFRTDPEVRTGSASDADYRRSGYDRGHLAPAADMGWSSQTMSESFYYSNMSPQVPEFNRGIWKRLEEQVRNWAVELDTIYVVTGPVLSGNMSAIGLNKVTVPNYYYKAVLYLHGNDSRMIGFIMPNASSKDELRQYAVSVDSIEKLTRLDLFTQLEDYFEKELERTICASCWNWSAAKKRKYMETVETESVQCSGITRAGNRCKRKTRHPSGRCYQHQ